MELHLAAVIFVAGAGCASIIWLVAWVRHLYQYQAMQDAAAKAREAELLAKIEKLKTAQKNGLPFRTAEEIEHAAAAILLEQELNYKTTLVQNLFEHLRKARENQRVVP